MTRQALVAYSVGLVGHDPGQDPRAGLLCKTERGDSGKDRHRHAGRHAAHEPRLRRSAARTPASRSPSASGACLNALLLYLDAAASSRSTCRSPAGRCSSSRSLASVAFMAIVLFTTMGEAAWWLAGALAAQGAGDPRPGAARRRRLRRVPARLRLPAARFLAARGGVMGVALEPFAAAHRARRRAHRPRARLPDDRAGRLPRARRRPLHGRDRAHGDPPARAPAAEPAAPRSAWSR